MASITQVPIATNFVLGEALGGAGYNGIFIVSRHSDGLVYGATDTASTSVMGYTLEGGAIGSTVRVFPGVDEAGKPIGISCKNSTTSALATTDIGGACYIESYADASDGFGKEWTVAKTSSNSIVAGIFRGFTGLDGTRAVVEVGRKNA